MNEYGNRPRGADSGSFTGTTAHLLLGPLVWAVHLLVIYAPQPALCAAVAAGTFGPIVISVFVLAATAAAGSVPAIALWRPAIMRRLLRVSGGAAGEIRFQDRVMRLLCVLSIVGIVWAGAAAALISPCLQMR